MVLILTFTGCWMVYLPDLFHRIKIVPFVESIQNQEQISQREHFEHGADLAA